MKTDIPFKKLFLLGCMATILVPLVFYLADFYNAHTTSVSSVSNPQFLYQGIILLALAALFDAILTAIIVGLFINYSKKDWSWSKLILVFGIIFIVILWLAYIFLRFYFSCLS